MIHELSASWVRRARRATSRCALVFGIFIGVAWSEPAPAESFDAKRTWAVVAGVLEWTDPGLSPFPKEGRKDRELYEKLGELGVPAAQRTLLLEGEATSAAIERALADVVARAGSDATLLFYFAGHGVRDDEDGEIVFTTVETRLDKLDRTGLRLSKLPGILAGFRGEKVILLADCCHSGGLAEVAEALRGKRQVVALTSSEASNTSSGNWTFTQTILDGFDGRALLDRNADGVLTLTELSDEVGEAMCHRERQRHGFANFGVAQDLVIARTRERRPELDGVRDGAGSAPFRHRDWVATGDAEIARVLTVDPGGRALVELYDYATASRTWMPLTSLRRDQLKTWPAGSMLRVEWEKEIYDAKVLEVAGGFMWITYPGYDAHWNEWIPAERVIGPKGGPILERRVEVEWEGQWYDARLTAEKGGKWCVRYVGFDAKWDECVPAERIRF